MTNGVATFIAVCLGILVLEITLVLTAFAILALRVAKTVKSVEQLVLRIEDKFASVKTSWMRVLQGAGGVLGGFVSSRRHARARAEESRVFHR